MITMNIQNFPGEGALSIGLTGMTIVFSGLLLISLFIGMLPTILDWIASLQKPHQTNSNQQPSAKSGTHKEEFNNEIAATIALVLQLEGRNQHLAANRGISHYIYGDPKNVKPSPKRRFYP